MNQTTKSKIDQDKIKINEVGKQFFEIQFEAKEKIITRLNEEIKDFNNKKEKFKGKINRLNNKLKDDYEYLKKILNEKINLEKILKAETAQLKQESNSMEETGLRKLKEQHDEFIKEAGKYKSITAIYVGRLNKLHEFSKHEELLKQKYTNIKEQNVITDINYEVALKNLEENKYKSEQISKRNMLKRCVDFSVHMKKQSLMVECPVEGASTKEVLDLKEMLDIGNKQNAVHEQNRLNLKEANNALNELVKELSKLNREKIKQKNTDDYSKEKNYAALRAYNTQQDVSILASELANVNDLQGIQRQDKDTVRRTARMSFVKNFDNDDAQLQAIDSDLHAAQVTLRDSRSANQLLNRRIWKVEDMLLNVYEKASVHLEEIKSNTNESEEKMNSFIQNLYKELRTFYL
ncbi:uncharacterized protein PFB0145c-like [Myzus persicae]|uniref:uncharacterized protein PFB0145c-like n=1 Tax=Myzus persicae TaxID=13164 RepID=UPI000B939BD7|nr:uncharacterized protein PFB0145c-like [Myzus persicae]